MARRSKRKLRIKNIKTKRTGLFLLFILALGALIYFAIFSDFFQLKEVQIKGNEKIKTQDILNVVEPKAEKSIRVASTKIFFSKSLLLIGSQNIQQELLSRFPEIGTVYVEKKIPRTLIVEVHEREPFAEICQPSGECFIVDHIGVAFEKSAILKEEESLEINVLEVRKRGLTLWLEDQIEAHLGQLIMRPDYLRSIDIAYKNLEQGMDLPIEKITFSGDDRVNIKTEQGFRIYFSMERSMEDQLFNLGLVLEEKISAKDLIGLEYIDLRFGNRVYYK